MTAPKVAIRLGTEGKEDVKRDAREVGDAWEASASRAVRAYDKAATDFESAERRRAAAAQKIAAIMPQTAVQMRINDAVGTGSSLQEGSARASAAAFRELFAEQERLTVGAAALRAQIDPTWAAQQRFNNEMAQTRTLIAAGSITLDEYCAKLRMEQGLLNEVSRGHVSGGVSAGQYKAGVQQLGFQFQDLGVQMAMAAGSGNVVKGVMTGLAMQGPQVVSAIALMRGSAGGLLGFLAGPWGAGLMAATSVLAILGAEFLGSGDKAKKAAGDIDIYTSALNRMRAAAGQAAIADVGLSKVRLAQLEGWRDNPGSDPNAPQGGNRAGDIARAIRRKELDSLIENQRATIKGVEMAMDARRKLQALAPPPARKTGGGSAEKKDVPKNPLDVEAIWRSNTAWGVGQETGGAARDALTQAGQALMDQQRAVQSINNEISAGTALLNIEWATRGKSRQEIEAAVEMKRFEITLQERGIDLASEEGKNAMARRAEQISFNQLIGASVDKMEALRDVGASAVSKLLDPSGWTSWKSLVLGVINDVTQALWKMAVINPIQNRLGGGSLPTIGNLLGLLGGGAGLGGVSASSMSYMNGLAAAMAVPRNLMGSAIGNNFTPAGAHLVGENGPEIVNMPRGAQVMTASDTRRAMAGNDNGLQIRVIKGDLFDIEVSRISTGVSAQVVGAAAPIIASGASNGAQQAVSRRNSRRLA